MVLQKSSFFVDKELEKIKQKKLYPLKKFMKKQKDEFLKKN